MDDFYGDPFREEFKKEFGPPYDEAETIQWIEAYLKRVENMVKRLEDVYNGSAPSDTRHSSLSSSAS